MPYLKTPRQFDPLWKEWDYNADKRGLRHTVFSVNADQYTGEWQDNLKHGKGTQKWAATQAIFEGDWKYGKRNGFGTLSYPDNSGKGYKKLYSGGWKNDKKHGYGTQFYSATETYEGEWFAGKRSGWGRMYYADDSIYEGEWYNDKRNGQGMLRLANDNRFEGTWHDDLKHGPGKFFFLDKGQVLEGVWADDIMKCGTAEDFGRETAPDPTTYPIPDCTVEDTEKVLIEAENRIMNDQDL